MTIPPMIDSFITYYAATKLKIGTLTGASQELLHVHIGLAIFVLVSLLLRKKFRSPIPLAFVTFFAIMNEVIDWLNDPGPVDLENIVDIANTVAWPIVLFLLARRWRQ